MVNLEQKIVVKVAFSTAEREKLETYFEKLMSKVDPSDPDYSKLEKETFLAIVRDIQAQRLPPNTRIPSRKNIVKYLKTVHNATGNWIVAFLSLLSPGSWTSTGGSFKLAEESGYDIVKMMIEKEYENGQATLLEIGAGYAGFKSDVPLGIKKLVEKAGDKMGNTIFAHFTNLTKWHDSLPKGVVEHPGYAARDILLLREEGVCSVDVIYSQCAAYFEPKIEKFVSGSAELLKSNGYLIFDAKPTDNEKICKTAEACYLQIEKIKELGGANGNLYVLRKP
jgi:hypothetical protein